MIDTVPPFFSPFLSSINSRLDFFLPPLAVGLCLVCVGCPFLLQDPKWRSRDGGNGGLPSSLAAFGLSSWASAPAWGSGGFAPPTARAPAAARMIFWTVATWDCKKCPRSCPPGLAQCKSSLSSVQTSRTALLSYCLAVAFSNNNTIFLLALGLFPPPPPSFDSISEIAAAPNQN